MTSRENALVKRAASLHLRKYRERERAFLVEGVDLVRAGLAAGLLPQAVFVVTGADRFVRALDEAGSAALPLHMVTPAVAGKLGTLQTPPDVSAIFPIPEPPPLASLVGAGADREAVGVYADRLADPGNLGTLVRAAAAFAAAALATSPGSVDLFSPKVVRASMGAVFALPLYPELSLEAFAAGLGARRVFGLVAHGGADVRTAGRERPAVVCVGAERAGLDPVQGGQITDTLTIPLAGEPGPGVESLNAGVAGAIALYELRRQSLATGPRREARHRTAPEEEER